MVSSGKAILNTLSDLRADDVDVLCAVCVIDRQSGGREALAERNLELRPLLTMDDLTTAARLKAATRSGSVPAHPLRLAFHTHGHVRVAVHKR